VTRAVRQAMTRIAEHHPQLGHHLSRTIARVPIAPTLPTPAPPPTGDLDIDRRQPAGEGNPLHRGQRSSRACPLKLRSLVAWLLRRWATRGRKSSPSRSIRPAADQPGPGEAKQDAADSVRHRRSLGRQEDAMVVLAFKPWLCPGWPGCRFRCERWPPAGTADADGLRGHAGGDPAAAPLTGPRATRRRTHEGEL
jgi:hypothetical protein